MQRLKVIEMRSYFAKQSKKIHQGGWFTVLSWSKQQVKHDPTPVKIFTARAGEKDARIIAEVTCNEIIQIVSGRCISLKRLLNGKE